MNLEKGRPADCAGRLEKEIRCYDMLDRLEQPSEDFDVDVLLAYGNAAPAEVVRQVKALTAEGKRVMAQRTVPTNIRYREILTIGEVDSNA